MVGNDLYVGGVFNQAGGVAARYVARWDGAQWHPMGDGLPNIAYCLVPDSAGLIAGTTARLSPGDPRTSVHRWDGEAWQPIGTDLVGQALSVVRYRGELIAAGYLYSDVTGASTSVVHFNGVSWEPLGNAPGYGGQCLLVANDTLYLGGLFSDYDSSQVAKPAVLRWTGSVWDTIGSSHSFAPPAALTLAWDAGSLVAGGFNLDFQASGDPQVTLTRFDGASWHPVPGAPQGQIVSVASGPDGLIVGGWFTATSNLGTPSSSITRLHGGVWDTFGDGLNYGVSTTAWYDHAPVAGGPFTASGDQHALYLARWNGSAWRQLEGSIGPAQGLAGNFYGCGQVSALTVHGGRLIAGGLLNLDDDRSNDGHTRGVLAWDGVRWDSLGGAHFFGDVRALVSTSSGLVVGGNFSMFPAGTMGLYLQNIALWEGHGWLAMSSGMDNSVEALAEYNGSLYAAGHFRLAGDLLSANIARWTGTEWRPVGGALTDTSATSAIRHLAVFAGSLYAGGQFAHLGSVAASNIARWDGTSWHPLDSGTDGAVTALAATDSGVMVAGDFTAAGSLMTNGMAQYDGTAWRAFGGDSLANLVELRADGGQLFASGYFDRVGARSTHGIARWDGQRWHALGSGLAAAWCGQPIVYAMQDYGGQLYMGGAFTLAGGKSAYRISVWSGLGPNKVTPSLTLAGPQPNPFAGNTTVQFELASPGTVRATVHDISGRVVRVLADGVFGLGPKSLKWDGRDRDGRDVPSGIYFLRLVTPNTAATSTRLALVR